MSTENDAMAELKRLAEAATPGPWAWVNSDNDESWSGGFLRGASLRAVAQFGVNETKIVDGKSYTTWALPKFIIDSECIGGDVESDATAEYLARFDPTTILNLIAAHAAQAERIKQLEHEIWCAGVNADGAREKLGEVRNAALEEAATWIESEFCSCCWTEEAQSFAEHSATGIRALKSQPVQQPGDAPDLSEQQVADMLRDPEILTDIGHRALINGDPIDAYLPWLTRVVNRALRSQPAQKGPAQ